MPEREIPAWLDPIWERWRTVYLEGRLPHAILITGPAGVGKRWLVEAFVRGVQCHAPTERGLPCGECPSCKQYVSRHQLEKKSHPDIDWLTVARYSIGINDIREQVIQRLTLKANYGRMRLLVIEPAERMTRAASNALLKSLEEPPPNTALFLISHQPGRLLATIRSRCQKYAVPQPGPERSAEWLANFMTLEQAKDTLKAGGGMPMRALDMHQSGQVEFRNEFEQGLREVLTGKLSETDFASEWNSGAQGKPKSKQGSERAWEDISMDLRLVWMMDQIVEEARKRASERAVARDFRAVLNAYQWLLEIRAREAAIPAPQLNLEAACLAFASAFRRAG